MLPFFIGFNHFYYLGEKDKGAEMLYLTSQLPKAPRWLGHLASILQASKGNLRPSIIWLRTLIESEQSEEMKARYAKDLKALKKALAVQNAIIAYRRFKGRFPSKLADLTPDWIDSLPELGERFELRYNKGVLNVVRK